MTLVIFVAHPIYIFSKTEGNFQGVGNNLAGRGEERPVCADFRSRRRFMLP
jgi:hypothetical protein